MRFELLDRCLSHVRDLAWRLLAQGGRCIWLVYVGPPRGQVIPLWVHRFDQANLLAATPRFNFLFAIDGSVRIDEFLVVDIANQKVQIKTDLQKSNEPIDDPSLQQK